MPVEIVGTNVVDVMNCQHALLVETVPDGHMRLYRFEPMDKNESLDMIGISSNADRPGLGFAIHGDIEVESGNTPDVPVIDTVDWLGRGLKAISEGRTLVEGESLIFHHTKNPEKGLTATYLGGSIPNE